MSSSEQPLFTKTSGGVYLARTAIVTGELRIDPEVSIWFGAVVRGDVAPIIIGRRTNIQDNAVVHCDSGIPNEIGQDVVIGHGAIVHGKKIGDRTLIGMGATVLGRSEIGNDCVIAAGAVVPPGLVVPDGMVVMGVPGKIVRRIRESEKEYTAWLNQHYVQLAQKHVDGQVGTWGCNA